MEKQIYDHHVVGERIRRRRMELGMTQAELAEGIGISTKYCADIERGYCGMSIETLLEFSRVLRMSPSVILLGEALPFSGEGDLTQQIMQGLGECTEEQQRGILEIIRLFAKRS